MPITTLVNGAEATFETIDGIISKLGSTTSPVTHLSFKTPIGTAEVEALANALQTNSKLTNLSLAYYCNVGAAGAQALANALVHNSTLSSLDLSSTQLGDVGVQALEGVLRANRTLKILRLRSNKITDAGAQNIAAALSVGSGVTNLDLTNNKIEAAGAQALAGALATNCTMTNLDLGHNSIGDVGVQYLVDALQDNDALTDIGLMKNNIGPAGAASLQKFLDRKTAVNLTSFQEDGVEADIAESIRKASIRNVGMSSSIAGKILLALISKKPLAFDEFERRHISSPRVVSKVLESILKQNKCFGAEFNEESRARLVTSLDGKRFLLAVEDGRVDPALKSQFSKLTESTTINDLFETSGVGKGLADSFKGAVGDGETRTIPTPVLKEILGFTAPKAIRNTRVAGGADGGRT